MLKKLILMLALGLCLVSQAQGLNIIWVCTAFDNLADGQNDDYAWAPWLQSLGHTVDAQIGNWATLDDAKIATLNAADVIIISRAMASDSTSGSAAEIAQWNAITTPIISLHSWNARNSRNQWMNSTTMEYSVVAPPMIVKAPTHPIFTGIALDASNQVAILDGTVGNGLISFVGSTQDVGSGTLLAAPNYGTHTWMAEWKPGSAFYAGSGTPAGKRLLFCLGTQEVSGTGTPTGALNLNDVGKKMFNNALYYMAGKAVDSSIAANGLPADGATDVAPDADLSWTAGENAITHDVYFGTSLADVNSASKTAPKGVLLATGQSGTTFDPGRLQLSQTYYWRVDEIDQSGTIHKGQVWKFAVEPLAYKVTSITATASSQNSAAEGPENTINSSGLTGDLHGADNKTMWLSNKSTPLPVSIQYNFDKAYKLYEMWVWNHNTAFESLVGLGAKDTTIEYSADGTTWTKLGDFEFAQAMDEEAYAHGTTVSFAGVAAQSVRFTISSAWASAVQVGLSEVRFFYIPVWAKEPQPTSGATGVSPTTSLSWRAGREAASHDVYLGTDANALTLAGSSAATSFTPAHLSLGTKYYWRVDEVNAAATPSTWAGDVWNFTTPEFLVVDDMESYNDTTNAIYSTWIDGYNTNTNGSQVGYGTAPFAETTIVHSGTKSMPFGYGNNNITTSEATMTFAAAQDWSIAGIKTLTIFFRGNPANTTGQLFVKINGTKINYSGDAAAQTSILWKQWNVDLTAVSGLTAVNTLTLGISGSGKGTLYFDDIRLYKTAPAVVAPVNPGTTGLAAYYTFEGDAKDSIGGSTGTLNSVTFSDSLAGQGKAATFNGTTSYVDLGASVGNLMSTLTNATFAVWVNVPAVSAWERAFDFGNAVTTGNPQVYMYMSPFGSANPRFAYTIASNTAEAGVTAPNAIAVGWHHLTGVVDAAAMNVSLYVDGRLAGTSGTVTLLPKDLGKTANNYVGRSQWPDPYLTGSVDELRIYNRVLSAGEVAYLAGDR